MTALMLNLYAILYSLAIKTLRIIHLHLIKDQYMIFALLFALAKQMIYRIYDDISLLFANNESIKTSSYSIS